MHPHEGMHSDEGMQQKPVESCDKSPSQVINGTSGCCPAHYDGLVDMALKVVLCKCHSVVQMPPRLAPSTQWIHPLLGTPPHTHDTHTPHTQADSGKFFGTMDHAWSSEVNHARQHYRVWSEVYMAAQSHINYLRVAGLRRDRWHSRAVQVKGG